MDLLCGFVPKDSVTTALGRSDFTARGSIAAAAHAHEDGTDFDSATCAVSVPNGGKTPAFSVKIVKFSEATGAGILRTAGLPNDFRYPADVGIGFASRDQYTDGSGRTHAACESGLVRGDWVITLGIEIPADGRDVVDDTVALAQEVVNQLRIPLLPTSPYPDPSAGGN